tara:strand:+ start:914 stop:1309 length:396 start_codon:yes stop_codon:yes gene_type:complete
MIADCEICGSVVDQSKVGKTVNSNGKHWHGKCYETQVRMDQHKACCDTCVSRLKVSAAEIARLTAELSTARNDALDEAVCVDFRELWLQNFDLMRASGESKEMAGRWFPQLCRAAITALKATPPAQHKETG